jgi:hypothetical protein
MLTRLQKGIRKIQNTLVQHYSTVCLTLQQKTHNITDALHDTTWKKAMEEEYDALMLNNTSHRIPKVSTKI